MGWWDGNNKSILGDEPADIIDDVLRKKYKSLSSKTIKKKLLNDKKLEKRVSQHYEVAGFVMRKNDYKELINFCLGGLEK